MAQQQTNQMTSTIKAMIENELTQIGIWEVKLAKEFPYTQAHWAKAEAYSQMASHHNRIQSLITLRAQMDGTRYDSTPK